MSFFNNSPSNDSSGTPVTVNGKTGSNINLICSDIKDRAGKAIDDIIAEKADKSYVDDEITKIPPTTLSSLSDVVVLQANEGDVLSLNEGKWVAKKVTSNGGSSLVTDIVSVDDRFDIIDLTPPKEVENVTISNPTITSFDVTFPDYISKGDATSYNIYLNGVLKGNVAARLDIIVTFPITNLIANTTYTIKVTAVNKLGIESKGTIITGKTNGTAVMTTAGGSGSYFSIPSLTLTKVEILCSMQETGGYLIESGGVLLRRNGADTLVVTGSYKEITVNGIVVNNNDKYPTGLMNVSVELLSPTATTSRLFILGKTTPTYVKVYNGNTLIASYDFTVNPNSTTIPDISGNGKNGTLTGGIWS